MALTLDPATKIISVPQADLAFVSGTLYTLDSNAFRKNVMALLDDEDYIWMEDAFIHATEVTVAGITYARTLEFINGYSITFEDTAAAYTIRIEGSNNNIFDIENGIMNPTDKVTVISTNSAGLISVGTAMTATETLKLSEIYTRLGLDSSNAITDTVAGIDSALGDIDINRTGDGDTTSTLTRQP